MEFYIGIVEDRNDPVQLGRVRVRCFGIHSSSKIDIPTETLPWATVMHSTHSAGNSGVGITSNLVEGTQVLVYFTDTDMQYPIIMGSLPGYNKSNLSTENGTIKNRYNEDVGFQDPSEQYPLFNYMNDVDTPKAARSDYSEHSRTHHPMGDELNMSEPSDIRHNSQYPFNNVTQTEAGHIQEFDNTPEFERINTQHNSGTFTEMRPDGDKVDKIVGNGYRIVAQGDNVYVEGNVNLHINTNCNTYIKGDYNLTVDGDMNITVDGNMDTDVNGHITEDATTINLNSGDKGAARLDDTTVDNDDELTGADRGRITSSSGTVFIGG